MISIIIIVKNDPRIGILLNKLESITYPEKTETIVVDASSKNLLDEIKKQHPNVQWIAYEPPKGKRTYAEQRNIGVKTAKGDLIVFIDADCVPDKEWLVYLIGSMRNENEKIISGAARPMRKNFIHKEEHYGKYREECETMNIAIAKEIFDKIGYFDEELEGCEDSDFCIRARENGYKIRYIKKAVIYHDWGGIIKNIIRSYNGGKDRIKLYTKHIKHLGVLTSNNIYTLYYLLFVLFSPIIIIFPLYILILFIPSLVKRRNPMKELFNVAFAVGVIKQVVSQIIDKTRKDNK